MVKWTNVRNGRPIRARGQIGGPSLSPSSTEAGAVADVITRRRANPIDARYREVVTAAVKRANYEDLFALPEHVVGEIVDGVLYANPRPAMPHTMAASAIGEELGGPFKRGRGGPGGWIIADEPELHFQSDVVVPDLAGWRRARMPVVERVPFLTLAPDWICEVLSPSTTKLDRAQKLPLYAREGVAHAWLVDPLARTLEVLRRSGELWLLVGTYKDDDRIRAEPFDAIELELGAFWADVADAPDGQMDKG